MVASSPAVKKKVELPKGAEMKTIQELLEWSEPAGEERELITAAGGEERRKATHPFGNEKGPTKSTPLKQQLKKLSC